jgi:hypothetical protein
MSVTGEDERGVDANSCAGVEVLCVDVRNGRVGVGGEGDLPWRGILATLGHLTSVGPRELGQNAGLMGSEQDHKRTRETLFHQSPVPTD